MLAVPHRRSCATASQPESPRPLWPAPQQPLEINDELLSFVAVQMNIDSERISDYASWQHTVSEHQARVQQYLGLRPFDLDESNALERFAFEESCRLEQTALLLARAQEFLHGPVFLVRRKRMSHTGHSVTHSSVKWSGYSVTNV